MFDACSADGSLHCSQAVTQHSAEVMAVRLGNTAWQLQAELDGFKSRALRAKVHAQRHLYASEWSVVSVNEAIEQTMLVLGGDPLFSERERIGSWAGCGEVGIRVRGSASQAVAMMSATQLGTLVQSPVHAIEVAVVLVQAQSETTSAVDVEMIATGTRETRNPESGGRWGLARSARTEALLSVRCYDAATTTALAHGAVVGEPEATWYFAAARVPRLSAAPLLIVMHTVLCMGGHVVTGGTSGLGLLTARWLAQSGAHAVAVASRSGELAVSTASEWEQVQAVATAARVQRCDMAQAMHVQQLAGRSAGRLGPAGVWHAAGVIADGIIPRQMARALARVYGPKAHGAWLLQRVFAFAPLRTCVLFSSVAALLGGPGQANYAAANACLDALASCCGEHSQAAVSVQWGAWAEVGMAARGAASERVAAMEAASGFGLIALAQGLAALHAAV